MADSKEEYAKSLYEKLVAGGFSAEQAQEEVARAINTYKDVGLAGDAAQEALRNAQSANPGVFFDHGEFKSYVEDAFTKALVARNVPAAQARAEAVQFLQQAALRVEDAADDATDHFAKFLGTKSESFHRGKTSSFLEYLYQSLADDLPDTAKGKDFPKKEIIDEIAQRFAIRVKSKGGIAAAYNTTNAAGRLAWLESTARQKGLIFNEGDSIHKRLVALSEGLSGAPAEMGAVGKRLTKVVQEVQDRPAIAAVSKVFDKIFPETAEVPSTVGPQFKTSLWEAFKASRNAPISELRRLPPEAYGNDPAFMAKLEGLVGKWAKLQTKNQPQSPMLADAAKTVRTGTPLKSTAIEKYEGPAAGVEAYLLKRFEDAKAAATNPEAVQFRALAQQPRSFAGRLMQGLKRNPLARAAAGGALGLAAWEAFDEGMAARSHHRMLKERQQDLDMQLRAQKLTGDWAAREALQRSRIAQADAIMGETAPYMGLPQGVGSTDWAKSNGPELAPGSSLL